MDAAYDKNFVHVNAEFNKCWQKQKLKIELFLLCLNYSIILQLQSINNIFVYNVKLKINNITHNSTWKNLILFATCFFNKRCIQGENIWERNINYRRIWSDIIQRLLKRQTLELAYLQTSLGDGVMDGNVVNKMNLVGK